jgi:branched-chain amino acid transport system substrate-binding protein
MKRKGFSLIALFSICLFITLLVLPLAAYAQAASPGEKTIPIGVIQALTGPGAVWGVSALRGAQIAAEEINKKGITVKGVTYKFKIIPEDDKFFADRAVDRVKKLIEKDRVGMVYGSQGSASSLAEAPICAKNKVLHFFCGYNTGVIAAENTYSFMLSVTPVFQAPGFVEFLARKIPGIQRVVLIHINDASGHICLKAYKPACEKKGWAVRNEAYERGIVEFGPLCTNVVAAKPQLVIVMSIPPGDGHKICKGLRELGYKGPIGNSGSFVMEELARMLGDNLGVVFTTSGIGNKPYANDEYAAFFSEYVKKYGKEAWTAKEIPGYSWLRIYAQAIEKAQTLDSTAIRDVLAAPGGEWYHLSGEKCYHISEKIVKEMGFGSDRVFNAVGQITTWDNVAKREVNADWLYPYGWPSGKLPD